MGELPLKIVKKDITKIICDAIVNPTDPEFSHSGGADKAIHEAAGHRLYEALENLQPLKVGEAVLTPGFDLPSKYVIHTVGPRWCGGKEGEEPLLRSCYKESLKLALEKGCESLAIPLISSGTFGFPKNRVLKISVDEIKSFLDENEMLVYIVIFDKDDYEVDQRLMQSIGARINDAFSLRMSMSMSAPVYMERMCEETVFVGADLDDKLRNMDKGFADTLFEYIDEKGITDVECYKRANVDKKTFSKIKCNKDYRPSKLTVVSFAIALHLNLKETERLLKTVGYALSGSSKFDIIIEYFVTSGNYKDIFDVNEVLYKFDQATLGV